MIANTSHGFCSLQLPTCSYCLHPFTSQIHTHFGSLWEKKRERDLQNMAVGRRQGLMADIPFLTFWGPPRRIYQILVHFLGLTVFLWSAERSKS